jgi:hypothetical protein
LILVERRANLQGIQRGAGNHLSGGPQNVNAGASEGIDVSVRELLLLGQDLGVFPALIPHDLHFRLGPLAYAGMLHALSPTTDSRPRWGKSWGQIAPRSAKTAYLWGWAVP